MGTREIEALRTALARNDHWAAVCTIAVFVGLLVEYTILLWLKRKELSRKELVLTILAGIAIAGGVYGEYHFGSNASDLALRLEDISEQQVANARSEAADANERASKADERASKNEEEAARLRQIAEHERLARIEIEEKVAWRRLTKKQQIEVGSSLSGFPGMSGSVWFLAGDIEGANFARDIASALRIAKWHVLGPGSVMEFAVAIPDSPPPTVGVTVVSTGDAFSLKASDILARSLNAQGFDCVKSTRTETRSGPALWVNIKSRPEGPQGEAKLRHRNRPKE